MVSMIGEENEATQWRGFDEEEAKLRMLWQLL